MKKCKCGVIETRPTHHHSRTAVTLIAVEHVQIMSSIRRLAVKSASHAVRAGMGIDDGTFPDNSCLDLVIQYRAAGRWLNHGPCRARRAGNNDEITRPWASCSDRCDDDFIIVIVRAAGVVDVRVVDEVYDIDGSPRRFWGRRGTVAEAGALRRRFETSSVHTAPKARLDGAK
jgi:hypothetical protein